MLYPIHFRPRVKRSMWGSESWMVSDVEGDVSVIADGFLKGNSLAEAVEVYMGELVGDGVFARFGEEFPLLVKMIDARQRLSVQVHPGDTLAAARHGAWGKAEMWYILSCEPGAELLVGFRKGVTREIYDAAVADGSVDGLLNRVPVEAGEGFFIPSGTVHSIGGGIRLIEIQQTSDVSYRIFDWDRGDTDGQPRELHTDLAAEALDFSAPVRRVTQTPGPGEAALLVSSPWFTVNLIDVAGKTERGLGMRDSFTIYICVRGEVTLTTGEHSTRLTREEVVLVPADRQEVVLTGSGQLLETYI